MRYLTVTALLLGVVVANPVPQDFDWDAIEGIDPIPTASIPVVDADSAQTTVLFSPSPAASSVYSAVIASPTDTSLKVRVAKPDAGSTTTDTPAAFLADTDFQNSALSAVTPTGYTQAYQNQTGSSEGVYGYMGYAVLSSYDTNQCAANCNAIAGCMSFNIYYERDPSVDPSDSNPDPSSVTVIKCVYWGGPVTQQSATNVGQYRNQFQVVIAGSNGYVNHTIAPPAGYSNAIPLGSSAINAPLDCNKANTYMGVKIFTSGAFDAGLCAAACSAQSAYNRKHPAKDGTYQTCQFFNTYVLYNNSAAVGQYCSLYNESWPQSFATNNGQYRGQNHFTIGYSFSFANSTANADQPIGCANKASP